MRVNPTSCLPRIKDEPSSPDIFQALAHLATLYSPQSLTSEESNLAASIDNQHNALDAQDGLEYQDAVDSAKADDNEKRYAMSWLTRMIGSGLSWINDETGVTSADALLDLAGRVLGGHAAFEEAGSILREFSFPLKEPVLIPAADALAHPAIPCPDAVKVVLRDDPLPPSNTSTEVNTERDTGSSQDAAAAVGVQTWGAAIVVSDVLVRHPTLFHSALASSSNVTLKIAELGAGTGLFGMVAAKMLSQRGIPADVVLTDYHSQVLNNLRHNVQENFATPDVATEDTNQTSVEVEHLDWLNLHQRVLQGVAGVENASQPKYDLLLLADVIYAPEHALWIRSSIETLLRQPSKHDTREHEPRAHIIMAVRGSGKFHGLSKTVEEAFKRRARPASCPSLSTSSTGTPLDTMPGTPSLVPETLTADAHKNSTKHSDLLRSRMDALSLSGERHLAEQHAELTILKRRTLDKRHGVGRNDEEEYLWFEIGWH